jgi:uncharacterized membrane protein YfcA
MIGYILIIIMGLILGLIGGGGSILTLPILVYGFDIPATQASGYSLFLVGATALFGVIIYGFKRQIAWKKGVIFSIPAIIGTFLTRKFLVPIIPSQIWGIDRDVLILFLFVIIMLSSAISLIRSNNSGVEQKSERQNELKTDSHKIYKIGVIFVEGLLVGGITGLVGAGGGFLVVPALIFLVGLETKTAVATSLLIIALKSLIGFSAEIGTSSLPWNLLFSLLGMAILGNLVGIWLNKYVPNQKLKVGFGYFIVLVSIFIVYQELQTLLT